MLDINTKCSYCGDDVFSETDRSYFKCYLNDKIYCCATCCIDELRYAGLVELCDDEVSYLFDGNEYEDSFTLMNDIGAYCYLTDNKSRRTFESEYAAKTFAEEVGGTYRMVQIPDYMRVDIVYVVEWREDV